MKAINFCFFITFILSITSTFSQNETLSVPKRIYTTQQISSEKAPEIDGKIKDEIWDTIDWATDFIETRPDENTPPTEQTRFKILYDQKYLYIALQAFDKSPDKIVKRLSRRDGFEGDRMNVIIDSYHDLRTAFLFTVTAAGVKGDEIMTDNGDNIDASWNPIWYTKANIDNEGWTAEMKIPFSQLRFGNAKEQVWGLNIVRNYFRIDERSLWQRIPAGSKGFVSQAGELHGLKGLKSQKQLEIQPFVVTQYDTYEKEVGNPFKTGNDFKLNGGLDAKIGITNDLTLDLTVNPDFGQVEADPSTIVLDGFQVFFREQRPFFVENKNIFDYRFANGQDNLFYSRRIGRNPQGNVSLNDGQNADIPLNTTILGAAKFSGKTKDGWSIGLLESVTSREYAEIDTNGERTEELVEPLTNYFVGRLQKDFNENNTFVGGIFTATNRENLPEQVNTLHKSAYTGGLDVKHQWKNREYIIDANVIASHVTGSKEAITATQESLTHLFGRVDAGHVEVDPNKTSLTGTGGKFRIGKQGGGYWRYGGGFAWRSPELELNDVGFLRQADNIRQFAYARWQNIKPVGNFREINIRARQFVTFDFEGNYNRIEYELANSFKTLNNFNFEFGLGHKPRIYINTYLQGGPRWRFSEENFIRAAFGTNEQKNFRTFWGVAYSRAKQNNFSFFNVNGDITYQPFDALRISFAPSYTHRPNKTQYVTQTDVNGDNIFVNGEQRYILAEIDNQSLSAAIRINYTINPNLSIQYYGQPFIFRARYKNFKYVTNSIADNLYDRFHQFTNAEIKYNETDGVYNVFENSLTATPDYVLNNPDFSSVQFLSNLVVRWEYIPGSELFFVWSQGVNTSTDVSNHLLTGINDGIFNQRPENTFLIKATYRFVL